MTLTEKYFNNYLTKQYSFEKNPKIAVAVSGGPDSMALVYLLYKWIRKNKGSIIALIINHQLRKEADNESKLVQQYLNSLNITSKIIKINKKNIKNRNMKEARDNRFSVIFNYLKKNFIFHIFLGHHQDDNIETYLLRSVAGSNFEGLNSIKNKSIRNEIQILRPLLNIKKKNIINFNKKNNIKYVEDPSNLDLNYSRVVVRKFLKENKKLHCSIENDFNLIKNLSSTYKEMIFDSFHKINYATNKNSIFILNKKFLDLDIEIKVKIIEIIFKYLRPQKNNIRYSKICNAIETICFKDKLLINLGGMRISKDSDFVRFY